ATDHDHRAEIRDGSFRDDELPRKADPPRTRRTEGAHDPLRSQCAQHPDTGLLRRELRYKIHEAAELRILGRIRDALVECPHEPPDLDEVDAWRERHSRTLGRPQGTGHAVGDGDTRSE